MTNKKILENCSTALKTDFLKKQMITQKANITITNPILRFLGLSRFVSYPKDVYAQEQLDIAYRSGYMDCYSCIRNGVVDKGNL